MSASRQTARSKDAADHAGSGLRPLSPAQLAQRLGIGEGKVRRWIELGQLRAVDLATQPGPGKRRRLRISAEDLAAFEVSRANRPAAPAIAAGRARTSRAKDVTEFIQ